MRISYRLVMLKVYTENEATKVKIKVSQSLIAVGAVRVRVPLHLGPSASLSFWLP